MATIRTLSVTNKVMLPSHEMVPLPALSPTMEVGTIKSWEVRNHKHLFNVRVIYSPTIKLPTRKD